MQPAGPWIGALDWARRELAAADVLRLEELPPAPQGPLELINGQPTRTDRQGGNPRLERRAFVTAAASLPLLGTLPRSAFAADTIHYWRPQADREFDEPAERIMKLFADPDQSTTVVQENIPNDEFMSKFTAAVVAGSRPETTMITAPRLPDMVAMDGLVDLSRTGWGVEAQGRRATNAGSR